MATPRKLQQRLRWAIAWSVMVIVAVACGLLGGGDAPFIRAEVLGRAPETLLLEFSGTVHAGVTATVVLRTIGSRDCTRPGPVYVSGSGMVVTLEPYDTTYVGHGECSDVAMLFPRAVNVTFPDSGQGTIRIIGRRESPPAVVTVDREVEVH